MEGDTVEAIVLDGRQTLILAVLVVFLGKILIRNSAFLRNYNIPEPVVGGLIASLVFGALYGLLGWEVNFALGVRDELLIVFFSTIGISSRIETLLKGGAQLGILLVLAVFYLAIQNGTGVGAGPRLHGRQSSATSTASSTPASWASPAQPSV
jgi:ESS family glutamate:Na+ symporter